MPTAESFKALGVGNGFPSCITKVDVSGYDYWTTLSGVNKDSPGTSDLLIAESLKAGMKLYWNLYGTVSPSSGVSDTASSSVNGVDYSLNVRTEPKSRVCLGPGAEIDSEFDGNTRAQLTLFSPLINRFYDGDTSSEDNFIGYGSELLINTNAEAGSGTVSTKLRLEGAINSLYDDTAYVEINGIHFVCSASAFSPTDREANASELTATASFSPYSVSSEITSLDFYTYA